MIGALEGWGGLTVVEALGGVDVLVPIEWVWGGRALVEIGALDVVGALVGFGLGWLERGKAMIAFEALGREEVLFALA